MKEVRNQSFCSKWDLAPCALFAIGVSALVAGVAAITLSRVKALHHTPLLFSKPAFWASLIAGGGTTAGLSVFMMAMSVKNDEIRQLRDLCKTEKQPIYSNVIIENDEEKVSQEALQKQKNEQIEKLEEANRLLEEALTAQQQSAQEQEHKHQEALGNQEEIFKQRQNELEQKHQETLEVQGQHCKNQLEAQQRALQGQQELLEELKRYNQSLKEELVTKILIPVVSPDHKDSEVATRLAVQAVQSLLGGISEQGISAFSNSYEACIQNDDEDIRNLALAMYYRAKERIASNDPQYAAVLIAFHIDPSPLQAGDSYRYDSALPEIENVKHHAQSQGLNFDYLLFNARFHARRKELMKSDENKLEFMKSQGGQALKLEGALTKIQPKDRALLTDLYCFSGRVFMILPTPFGQGAQKRVFYAVDVVSLEVAAYAEMTIDVDTTDWSQIAEKKAEKKKEVHNTYYTIQRTPNALRIYDHHIEDIPDNDEALKLTTVGAFYALGDLYDHCPIYIDNQPLIDVIIEKNASDAMLEQLLFAIKVDLNQFRYVLRNSSLDFSQHPELQRIQQEINSNNPFLNAQLLQSVEFGRFMEAFELLYKRDRELASNVFNQSMRRTRYAQMIPGRIGDHAWEYAYKLASALSHLHKQKSSHNDIKPQNCFISSQFEVVLGDFDAMSKLNEKNNKAQTTYRSPQLTQQHSFDNQQVNTISEVFGWAGTVYSMLTGRHILEHAREVHSQLEADSRYPLGDKDKQDGQYEIYSTWLMGKPERWNAVKARLLEEVQDEATKRLLEVVLNAAAPTSTLTMQEVTHRLLVANPTGIRELIEQQQTLLETVRTRLREAQASNNMHAMSALLEEAKELQRSLEKISGWINALPNCNNNNNHDNIIIGDASNDDPAGQIQNLLEGVRSLIQDHQIPSQVETVGWSLNPAKWFSRSPTT